MFKLTDVISSHNSKTPDYLKLVEFLIEPLLESPKSLSIDCEKINSSQRVWIRLAVDEVDKGRIYGRGGRNIQAIQTILTTAASTAGQSLYLDIHNIPDKNIYSQVSPRNQPMS
ncbi:MAG: KH domain-containing protein [Candidatus Atelocyanobacterium thalassa]